MAFFELLEHQILISRKIWMVEKFCNFHTVPSDLDIPVSIAAYLRCNMDAVCKTFVKLAAQAKTWVFSEIENWISNVDNAIMQINQ